MVKDESENYFYQGQTLLCAAAHLSVNDFKGAVGALVRTNELYLAYYVSKFFFPEALKEVALLLAEKAERFFQSDLVLHLLSTAAQDHAPLARRRMLANGLIKKSQN
mmetsp:Transcript_38676/g.28547  ORF Transcript_38676/g.28547 Transcript_38676/m.28547 type:complete len:107 (-) Transcript_38676:797-1117(-)